MYEQTQGTGAQGAGPDMSGMGGAAQNDTQSNDDVVDGDYKEV